ncbi:MAG: hypothetical protein LBF58_07145 [Deltaproteobacteria bacterium]|jgi:hypothetical protein|nr:hypothetical protein [Deltaproteobacteria bacterium]
MAKKFILFFLFILAYLLVDITLLSALEKDEPIEIWNTNSLSANHGYFSYFFYIDSFNITGQIDKLIIKTNIGEMEFNDVTGSRGGRYQEAMISTDQGFDFVEIIQAIGIIGGKQYDVTNNIKWRIFEPKPIIIRVSPILRLK